MSSVEKPSPYGNERPSAAAAAEQSASVVIEPAPLASQLAPDVKVTKTAGGGGGGDGGDCGGGDGDGEADGGDGEADGGDGEANNRNNSGSGIGRHMLNEH